MVKQYRLFAMKRVFKRQLTMLCLLFLGVTTSLFGQLYERCYPHLEASQLRTLSAEGFVELVPPSEGSIRSFIEENLETTPFKVMSLGIPISTSFTPENSGMLFQDSRGSIVWRLALKASGASSLQLYFGKFHLPRGGKLFFLSPSGKLQKGAYTEKNNTSLNALALSPIEGDETILYYEGPIGDNTLPQLELQQITFGLWSLKDLQYNHPAFGKYKKGEPWFLGDFSCSPNVVAFPDWERQSHSLVLLMIRGNTVCSGTLINNSRNDGTAYVLTASHCMNASFKRRGDMDYVRESARQTVFFFNFRSPLAEKMIRGVEEQSLSGAEVVAYDEGTDLCLLRIIGVDSDQAYSESGGIPTAFMPYFSGWNAEENPKGSFVNLHHPTSSVARYNQYGGTTLKLADFGSSSSVNWKGIHYHIPKWQIGTTAGGSSGSPLYDKQKRIIGALTGGASTCSTPTNDAFYAISKCFSLTQGKKNEERLAPWLAPDNSITQLDGYEPYAPLSPTRLSHNYYSLLRERIEEPQKELFAQLLGATNRYSIATKSKLLGMLVVANLESIGSQQLPHIVAWVVDTLGGERKLFSESMTLPAFHPLTIEDGDTSERTLIGWIEFFIPLEKYNAHIDQGESLWIGFEMPNGTPFPFSILRGRDNNVATAMSYFKLKSTTPQWIKGDEEALPEGIRSRGNLWIDPIILPLKEMKNPQLDRDICVPKAYILGGKIRIMMPEHCSSSCSVSLYSLSGERLHTICSDRAVADFELPQKVLDERWLVLYFSYGDKQHYGAVLDTSLGY